MLHAKDLIPRLLARWHWIVLGLVLGLAFGMYQVWRAIPTYESLATVIVPENAPAQEQMPSRVSMAGVKFNSFCIRSVT